MRGTVETIVRWLVVAAVAAALAPAGAGAAVPGANDPSCSPNALLHPHPLGAPSGHGHPPVVLVHGTAVPPESMSPMSIALRAAGYCPWAVAYPTNMASDTAAPDTLSDFVGDVLAATGDGDGTGKVSMVGHSQGGMQIRHMLQHHDEPVEDAISLAGTQKGSAQPMGAFCTSGWCPPGFAEQRSTSPFYDHLNGAACSVGGPLDDANCWAPRYGDADYTNLATATDELVFPYWRALMGPQPSLSPASDAKTTDVLLQAWCPAASPDHLTIGSDPHAIRLVLDALGRPGPADASIPCASDPT